MATTGTGEPGNTLLLRTQVHTQVIGDQLIGLFGIDSTLGGFISAVNQTFGEWTTPGAAAGTAIGPGQEIFHIIDTGVFVDKQALIGQHQDGGEYGAEYGHKTNGKGYAGDIGHLFGPQADNNSSPYKIMTVSSYTIFFPLYSSR
jgi:hypothetical protein